MVNEKNIETESRFEKAWTTSSNRIVEHDWTRLINGAGEFSEFKSPSISKQANVLTLAYLAAEPSKRFLLSPYLVYKFRSSVSGVDINKNIIYKRRIPGKSVV